MLIKVNEFFLRYSGYHSCHTGEDDIISYSSLSYFEYLNRLCITANDTRWRLQDTENIYNV